MNGFVDKQEIEEFLRVVQTGSDHIDSLVTDENVDDPFVFAVRAYLVSVGEKLKHIRKVFGEWPALIDHNHPAHAEMYAAAQRIAENTVQWGVESAGGRRQRPTKRRRRAAEPFYLYRRLLQNYRQTKAETRGALSRVAP